MTVKEVYDGTEPMYILIDDKGNELLEGTLKECEMELELLEKSKTK